MDRQKNVLYNILFNFSLTPSWWVGVGRESKTLILLRIIVKGFSKRKFHV